MSRIAFAVGLGVVAAGGLWAVAEDGPALKRPTEELVKDLGAADYRVRETAGRELARRGDAALPELRAALADADPETGRRAAALVKKIEYDRLTTPKRVTLKLTDRPIKEAVEAVAKQTGYKIDYGGGGRESKYTFDIVDVPFWQAVDQIANAAGLVVYPEYDEDGGIRVWEQDSHNPHVAYSGPFRFLATNISSNRNIQLSGISRRGGGGRDRNDYINLNFQIQAEPKTPILGTTHIELVTATDDTGANLCPPPNDPNNSRSSYYGGGYRGYNTYAGVNLLRGSARAATAKTVKGKVGVQLLSGTRPEAVLPDPVGVKNKKVVGRTAELDIESLTEANDAYTMTVTAKRLGGGNEHDYSWGNNVWQRIELQDDKGVKLKCSQNSSNNSPNAVQLTLNFTRETRDGKKPGKPVKLVFVEWLTVVNEVTFEFKDLPLP